MYKNHALKALSKTQADGAQTLGNKGFEYLPHHQVQIEVPVTPSAGTLKIEILTPGASEYIQVSGSPVDLTAITKAAAFRLDNLFVESFRFTPVGLDTGKVYSVIVSSNE